MSGFGRRTLLSSLALASVVVAIGKAGGGIVQERATFFISLYLFNPLIYLKPSNLTFIILIIIIYFKDVHFFHATIGLDVCPYEVPNL